jgi:hypothetical protein
MKKFNILKIFLKSFPFPTYLEGSFFFQFENFLPNEAINKDLRYVF